MAWSDAARAAALAARRAHSSARRGAHSFAVGMSPLSRTVALNTQTRKNLAGHLRAFRKGGAAMRKSMKMGYTADNLYRDATASTALRNMMRRSGKKRR